MWYQLDINKLIELLTPTFLRKERMLAWLRVIHFPLIKIMDDFNFNRNQNLYNLAYNGQVCYLRKALNDRFDIAHTDGEKKPKFLGTIYLHDDADYSDTGVDFVVLIPAGLNYNDYEMRALIDFYKLASKRYKIQTK